MTIESLLEMPADDIAKLSDTQLTEWLAPYFPVTRPADLTPGEAVNTSGFASEIAEKLAELKRNRPSLLKNLKSSTPTNAPQTPTA